jgi:hypothetical protein
LTKSYNNHTELGYNATLLRKVIKAMLGLQIYLPTLAHSNSHVGYVAIRQRAVPPTQTFTLDSAEGQTCSQPTSYFKRKNRQFNALSGTFIWFREVFIEGLPLFAAYPCGHATRSSAEVHTFVQNLRGFCCVFSGCRTH